MIKNILIISSNFTGHGHKSITESLLEQFSLHPDINVQVVDGFSLGGNMLMKVGKSYGSVTRNAKDLWKFMWDISLKKPSLLCEFIEIVIRDSFLKLLRTFKPDLILSVHPNFNGSVINILKEYNIDIPFVTFIADIVSISPLWADPRVDYILCPTKESLYKCLEFGVSESKLRVTGFPVRSRFCEHIGKNKDDNTYKTDRPVECLIMSGGEGVGNMSRIAKILLKNFNCNVKIIAGRNAVLKRRLEHSLLDKYPDKVKIYGFLDNVQDVMLASDIAFTRGSPNVMMEAVSCNVPLVITGALPGQEEANPAYAVKYKLGVVCKELSSLKSTVSDLLANNAQKLNNIKSAQRDFRNPDAAKNIVDFILGIESRGHADIPETASRYKGLNGITLQSILGPEKDFNFAKKTLSLRTAAKTRFNKYKK